MTFRPILRQAAGRGLAFAAVAAGLVALRILERGETFQPRTLLLLAMVAGGALAAGLAVFAVTGAIARGWPPLLRGALAAPVLAGGFAGCTGLIFALIRPLNESDVDQDHHALEFIGILIDAAGLFVTTGGRYWLPWPIAAIGLAGGLIAARPVGQAPADAPARTAPSPPERALHGAR